MPTETIVLKKGEEMGRFLLGSTIVMLFRRGAIAFNEDWAPDRPVRLGELMGNRACSSTSRAACPSLRRYVNMLSVAAFRDVSGKRRGSATVNLDDLLSFSAMTLEETRAAPKILLEMMEEVDPKHLANLTKLCR